MVLIREGIVPDDVEMCAQIWVRAVERRDGAVDAAGTAHRVRSSFANPIVRFAVAGSPRAGFALTEFGRAGTSEALLHYLTVDPDGLGAGVGTGLLADAIEHAVDGGFRSLVLDVRPENERAIGLYVRAGFLPEGEPRPLWSGGHPMQSYRLLLG